MEVNKVTVVKFVAGLAEQDLRRAAKTAALSEPTAIYVGKAMRVTLVPNASFEIKATTNQDQATGTDKTAVWMWDVKPLNDQVDELVAKIEVFELKDDGSFGSFIDDHTESVRVTVHVDGVTRAAGAIDKASFIGTKLTGLFGTWQKTIGALVALLGAIGLLAWKLGLRRAKPAE